MTAKLYNLDDRRPKPVDSATIAKKLCAEIAKDIHRGYGHVCGENFHWLMPEQRCPYCLAEHIE